MKLCIKCVNIKKLEVKERLITAKSCELLNY